jgi:hypothetical protein
MIKKRGLSAILMMSVFGLFVAPAQAVVVGLELSLLLDTSGSIDSSEFQLQKQGYSDAFRSTSVQDAILANPTGQIAVNMVMWSGTRSQSEVVGWTMISNIDEANAFADSIDSVDRPFGGNTAPQSALSFAAPLFNSNNFDADRQVIDVSGDGEASGRSGTTGRDAALSAGVDTINGLVIGGDSTVLSYYTDNIQAGSNSFVAQAADFDAFGIAIGNKLGREITPDPIPDQDPDSGPIPNPVPIPAALWLFGSGIGGLLALKRRRSLDIIAV